MAEETKKAGKAQKPTKSSEKPEKVTTLANVTKLFWVALSILIFLLILSIAVLSTRMYKHAKLKDEGRMIAISADSVENFDIFSAEYKSETGETIIKSSNGDPVIAPGAKHDYTFRIKNEDKVAIDYTFNPKVEYIGAESIPIEIRLISPDEEYLIGSSKEWGTFDDFKNLEYTSTLVKDEIDSYELQWRWPFEHGDDEGDTALGNAAVGINVGMGLHSEMNTSKEANGGLFGLGLDDILWWLIFLILLLIAIVLFILSLITRKVKDPEPVVIYANHSAPEPVAVPVPVSAARKKNKGFVGKMAYVNIDTLVDIFNNGDTISLKILKEKGLVEESATQVKILARNDMELNKAFHIETQGISGQARQKVIAAGGTIKIIDG
jgi:hypothetical protein